MITLTRLRLALGALCGILVLALAYECFFPVPDIEVASVRLARPMDTFEPPPAFRMPPPSSFAAIDMRPVFDASRRPVAGPPNQPSAGGAMGTLPAITLVGVIIDGQTRLALIKSPLAPQALSYSVGSSISGWQIASIEVDKVILRARGMADQIVQMTAKSQVPAPRPGDPM